MTAPTTSASSPPPFPRGGPPTTPPHIPFPPQLPVGYCPPPLQERQWQLPDETGGNPGLWNLAHGAPSPHVLSHVKAGTTYFFPVPPSLNLPELPPYPIPPPWRLPPLPRLPVLPPPPSPLPSAFLQACQQADLPSVERMLQQLRPDSSLSFLQSMGLAPFRHAIAYPALLEMLLPAYQGAGASALLMELFFNCIKEQQSTVFEVFFKIFGAYHLSTWRDGNLNNPFHLLAECIAAAPSVEDESPYFSYLFSFVHRTRDMDLFPIVLNQQNNQLRTPLHLLCMKKSKTNNAYDPRLLLFQYLGGDPLVKDRLQETPLGYYKRLNSHNGCFLSASKQVESPDLFLAVDDLTGLSPLHSAMFRSHFDMICTWLTTCPASNLKIAVNSTSRDGDTLLHCYCKNIPDWKPLYHDLDEMLLILLMCGANPYQYNSEGNAPFHCLNMHHPNTLALLKAFYLLFGNNLLDFPTQQGTKLVHFAAIALRVDILEFLEQSGIDLLAKDSMGYTALDCLNAFPPPLLGSEHPSEAFQRTFFYLSTRPHWDDD